MKRGAAVLFCIGKYSEVRKKSTRGVVFGGNHRK